jgi:hypothetical protein
MYRTLGMVSVLVLLVQAFGLSSEAQQRGQQQAGQVQQQRPTPQIQQQQQVQQARQQQQMAQMQEMIRNMEQIANGARQVSQAFGQQIEQAQGQLRERLRVFQQMCDSIDTSARETRRSMDRIQEMLQDQAMTQDQDMQRDMDQMREHLQAVSDGLEDAVSTMDQIQQRLRTPAEE